eukprot:767660-Prorocentrum_minimum.AAC.2
MYIKIYCPLPPSLGNDGTGVSLAPASSRLRVRLVGKAPYMLRMNRPIELCRPSSGSPGSDGDEAVAEDPVHRAEEERITAPPAGGGGAGGPAICTQPFSMIRSFSQVQGCNCGAAGAVVGASMGAGCGCGGPTGVGAGARLRVPWDCGGVDMDTCAGFGPSFKGFPGLEGQRVPVWVEISLWVSHSSLALFRRRASLPRTCASGWSTISSSASSMSSCLTGGATTCGRRCARSSPVASPRSYRSLSSPRCSKTYTEHTDPSSPAMADLIVDSITTSAACP